MSKFFLESPSFVPYGFKSYRKQILADIIWKETEKYLLSFEHPAS